MTRESKDESPSRRGIRASDLERISAVAKQTDQVIMIRHVEAGTAMLIDLGYPTKNFHVKGKSSNWGPMAGFIPVDQSLSKLAGQLDRVPKYSRQVASIVDRTVELCGASALPMKGMHALMRRKNCTLVETTFDDDRKIHQVIQVTDSSGVPYRFNVTRERTDAGVVFHLSSQVEKPHAKVGNLVLSEDLFKSRCKTDDADGGKFYVVSTSVSASGKNECVLRATDPQGGEHDFVARQQADGWHIFRADGETPVQVLHDMVHDRPLVADYDLCAIVPRMADYGVEDRLPYPHMTVEEEVRNSPSAASVSREELTGRAFALEDPEMGNISARVRRTVRALNRAIERGPGLDVFHHNTDLASPVSDLSANFPITVCLPTIKKGPLAEVPNVLVVHDRVELRELIQQLKDAGFHVRNNARWGELSRVRSHQFVSAREMLISRGSSLWSASGSSTATPSEPGSPVSTGASIREEGADDNDGTDDDLNADDLDARPWTPGSGT